MKQQRIYFLLPLFIFLGIAIFLWRGLSLDPHNLPSVLINKAVPVFSLPELTQVTQRFTEQQLQGHVCLVNVWATWCINCHLEHPVLMDIARTQHLPIYGIDYKDSDQKALLWLNQYGNPYTVVGADHDGTVAINWGVYGTPETFIIDAKGKIRFKHIGPVTEDVWQNEIQPEVNQLLKN